MHNNRLEKIKSVACWIGFLFCVKGIIGVVTAFHIRIRNFRVTISVPRNGQNNLLMKQQQILRGSSFHSCYRRPGTFTTRNSPCYLHSPSPIVVYSVRPEKNKQFQSERPKRIIMKFAEESNENSTSFDDLGKMLFRNKNGDERQVQLIDDKITAAPIVNEENTDTFNNVDDALEVEYSLPATIMSTPRLKGNTKLRGVPIVTPPLLENLVDDDCDENNVIPSTPQAKSKAKNEYVQTVRRSSRIKSKEEQKQLLIQRQFSTSPYSNKRKRSLFGHNETKATESPPSKSSDEKPNRGATKQTRKTLVRKQESISIMRTESFGAVWSGISLFQNGQNKSFVPVIPPHTLILGTHPSIASLTKGEYYGHTMNAFWWIAGDCLGFRRDAGISATGVPYKFTSALRYGNEDIIPYQEQLKTLVTKGFALWDIVKSCKRIGSLDTNIENEIPNDIRSFCKIHPTIRRIVFANGSTGSPLFIKHNLDWLASGELQPLSNHSVSQTLFQKVCYPNGPSKKQKTNKKSTSFQVDNKKPYTTITLISAISVSPAAARYTYTEKRDFWERYVYQPGLKDLEAASTSPYFTK